MDEVQLIMHNVGHGLAVSIIEYPTKYVTEIDLGSEERYSPLAYLMSTRRLRTDVMYITHPHGDHLSDVSNALDQTYCPNSLNYQEYDWDDVANRQTDEARDILNSFLRLKRQRPYGEYQGGGSVKIWRWTPENAKTAFGESSYVNNSSLCIIYTWQDFKMCICGDLETQAVERLLGYDKAQNDIRGYDILVAPHHGHREGYTSKWVDYIGKPHVSLISVQSRDESVASGYESSDFARGITFAGEKRYALTTRKDNTVIVKMYYKDGKPTWTFSGE